MATKFPIFIICFFFVHAVIFDVINSFTTGFLDKENKFAEIATFILYLIGGLIIAAVIAKVVEYIVTGKYSVQYEKLQNDNKSWIDDLSLIIYMFIGQSLCKLLWNRSKLLMSINERVSSTGNNCNNSNDKFSTFLCSLILFCFSASYMLFKKKIVEIKAVYKWFLFPLSDILSRSCFDIALLNISYLSQTAGTSFRLLPVMAISKILLNRKYTFFEYGTSIFISIGMTLILYSMIYFAPITEEWRRTNEFGFVLLILSKIFGGFSPVWALILLVKHKMTYIQALCGGNFAMAAYYGGLMFNGGEFQQPLECIIEFPDLIGDYLMASIKAVMNQLTNLILIYWIQPDLFMIMDIVNQAISVVSISWQSYQMLPPWSTLGITILTGAVAGRLYFDRRVTENLRTFTV